MTENGQNIDQGLAMIRECFREAVFLCDEARECADLMMAGKHRWLELPDSTLMEIYGLVTEGKKAQLKRTNNEGKGFRVFIESYTDLRDFITGELEAFVHQETRH